MASISEPITRYRLPLEFSKFDPEGSAASEAASAADEAAATALEAAATALEAAATALEAAATALEVAAFHFSGKEVFHLSFQRGLRMAWQCEHEDFAT